MKRITLFAGHYGSGKTSIAVSWAKHLKKQGFNVAIVDLDIVNPYFRTKDSEKELEDAGIELICSEYANTNLDAPALPKEIYTAINDREKHLVIDVGGDDRGAVALGRYTPDILEENSFEMLFVANCYRPLTKTAEDALEIMREIEQASHLPFTAIVNNSNIGDATTSDEVKSSQDFIENLSKLSGLPVYMTTAVSPVYETIKNDYSDIFKIELQDKYYKIN
ncbi:MAG: hypothetical protein J6C82_07320 [Clostridia bacterium]|nr:hypothetical protein [Clostridia bacterium]